MCAEQESEVVDLFVIGGGVNGCGIARDAAGRGLSVVLAEKNDLASATSSNSTKLFHGGLRYLEYFKFRLVREALKEREVLLRAMPHICQPMRFVLPLHKTMRFESDTPTSKLLNLFFPWLRGQRPAWLIRLGLFIYDILGERKILPATSAVDLSKDPAGQVLKPQFQRAYEYSDCWVDDARLVMLNARDAQNHGAQILTATEVVGGVRQKQFWTLHLQDKQGRTKSVRARAVVNAAGPWVDTVLGQCLSVHTGERIRLVRGSHIVTKKLFDHDRAYFFQGSDGRIIFAIPYERDFTLIGTTDEDHNDAEIAAQCSVEEQTYLCRFASQYFSRAITREDIVWTYSGVRPLYDDGASAASSATRDYVLSLNSDQGAPILSVFGGKITTYRRLSEAALAKLQPFFPELKASWTEDAPLPGGAFVLAQKAQLIQALQQDYPFLDDAWAVRIFNAYGLLARSWLDCATSKADLGQVFVGNLTEAEVRWMVDQEYARSAQDILWRRSKLGLWSDEANTKRLSDWLEQYAQAPSAV